MHREMLHEYSTIMIFKGLFKLKRAIKYYHWNLEVLLISSIVLIVLLVLVLFILIYIWTFVQCLILKWALSASQWQLKPYSLPLCSIVIQLGLWMSDSFLLSTFWIPPKWLQHCLFVTWLVLCATAAVLVKFCAHHTIMHHFTVSLYLKPQM